MAKSGTPTTDAAQGAPVTGIATDGENITIPIPADGAQADAAQEDGAQADATPVDEWDALPEPKVMENKTVATGSRANVLVTIPAPIRKRAEQSLTENSKRKAAAAASNATRLRVDYHWQIQPVTSIEQGKRFADALTKYAKYRPENLPIEFIGPDSPLGQITARCGDVSWYFTHEDGETTTSDASTQGAYLGVRYSVRPFEARNTAARVPGAS